jgi:hypothetical protein
MAYLVLSERGSRKYRLALACRIAGESMPRGGKPASDAELARARTRTLSRAMRCGRLRTLRLRVGLSRWAVDPEGGYPDIPGSDHLRELPPEVRVAYVLRKVEGRYRYAVHDQLVDLGVRDALAVVDAADLLAPRTGNGKPALRVPPPALPAVYRPPSLRPIAFAMTATVVLVGGVVAGQNTRGHAHPPAAQPELWRGVAAWPTRGELAHDRSLTGAALKAWRTPFASATSPTGAPAQQATGALTPGDRPAGAVRLLYAGAVRNARIALLTDGRSLARYTRAPAGDSLDVFPIDEESHGPLILARDGYLMPPGVSDVRVSTMTGGPDWRAVSVRNGVAAVMTSGASVPHGCWDGPILSFREPSGVWREAADLTGLRASAISLAAWSSGDIAIPAAMTCELPRPAAAVRTAAVTRFWTGTFPDGTAGSWVCARFGYVDGRVRDRAVIFEGDGSHWATGDCGESARDEGSGTWWTPNTGPDVGHWFYLAAAASGLSVRATGPFSVRGRWKGLFVGEAKGGDRPSAPVTLTITSP